MTFHPLPHWSWAKMGQSKSLPRIFWTESERKSLFSVEAIKCKTQELSAAMCPVVRNQLVCCEKEADMPKAAEVRNWDSWKLPSPWLQLLLKLHIPSVVCPALPQTPWASEPGSPHPLPKLLQTEALSLANLSVRVAKEQNWKNEICVCIKDMY